MLLPPSVQGRGGPGVIDFQDALRGPIGYDLVSLLKDCYISWSRERVERWVKGYRRVLGTLGANVGDSEYQFLRWFDLVGVQRHIKVLGIFCRLWYRDGKSGYLGDLPLVFDYVRDACRRYPELVEFGRWLESRVAPLFGPALAREQARAIAMAAAKAVPRKRKAKRVAASRRAKKTRAVARKRVVGRKRGGGKKRPAKKKKVDTQRRTGVGKRVVPKRKRRMARRAVKKSKRVTRRAPRRTGRKHK